jgi:hypothetical protein
MVKRFSKTIPAAPQPRRRSEFTAEQKHSGISPLWRRRKITFSDLDEPVAETIPSWRKDARKSRVTIRQLLDFSCGLAPGFGLQVNEYGNRDKTAIALPMVAEPGKAFIYGPSALQVFMRS